MSAATGQAPLSAATGQAPMSAGAPVAGGVEAPASAVPWESVGPGWFVALWGPHAAVYPGPAIEKWEQQKTTLFLVDPRGGRYLIATLPAPSLYQLYDWSGDGRRVLIGTPTDGSPSEATGRGDRPRQREGPQPVHELQLQPYGEWYQFTRPMGLALLRSSQAANGVISVTRLSLSGETQQVYPAALPAVASVNTALLPSLDGKELVVAAAHGLALFANNGTFLKDIGPSTKACSPDRWWDATDLVASCQSLVPQFERRGRALARSRQRTRRRPS